MSCELTGHLLFLYALALIHVYPNTVTPFKVGPRLLEPSIKKS